MKRFYLIILLYPLLILTASCANAQSCKDSGFRKIFYSPGDTLRTINITNTPDGGSLLTGNYHANGATFKDAAAIKLDPNANQLWAKKFATLPGSDFLVNNSALLTNGNIILAGKQNDPVNPLNDIIVLVNIDANGNVNWANGYLITPPIGNNCKIEITSITEGAAGDIIITGSLKIDGSSEGYSLLTKINSSGNLLFSKLFVAGPGALDAFANAFVDGNSIIVFGISNDIQCQDLDPRSIYAVKLRYNDGSIEFVNRYCFAPFPGANSYGWLTHNFKATKSAQGYSFYGDFAENGTGRDILVVKFDSSLNYITGTTIKNFNSNAFHHINVSGDGSIHFFEREGGIQQFYFSSLTDEGLIKRQRKLQFPVSDFEHLILEGGRRIAFKPNSTSFILNYADVSGRRVIEYLQLLNEDTANAACLGIDTAFSTVQPFQVYFSNNQWDNILDDVLIASPVVVTASDINLIEENSCKQVINCDSIKISGPDSVCVIGQTTRLFAGKNKSCPGKVEWSIDPVSYRYMNQVDDSTVDIIFVSPAQGVVEKTIYAVVGGCTTVMDSMKIKLFSIPNSIGSDTTICAGDSLKLTIGNWFKSYLWQDGSTDSVLFAKEPGTYWVRIQAYCGYIFSDTVRISINSLPVDFIYHDTAICKDGSLILQPYQNYSSYLWSDGSAGPRLTITGSGRYTLQVTDGNGCKNTEEVVVRQKTCAHFMQFPNAFTPDRNGINDVFKPLKTIELVQYHLSIYNRWGQKVFDSDNPLTGWDGTVGGKLQNSNVFVWVCHYQTPGTDIKELKGTVTLIRQ